MLLSWRLDRVSLGPRKIRASIITFATLSLVSTAFLLWTWPTTVSAIRSLAVLAKQPDLSIPNDTRGIERAIVIPKTRHDDVRWLGGFIADP